MTERFIINNDIILSEDKIETYEVNTLVDQKNGTFYFIVDSLTNVKILADRLNELEKDNAELEKFRYNVFKSLDKINRSDSE